VIADMFGNLLMMMMVIVYQMHEYQRIEDFLLAQEDLVSLMRARGRPTFQTFAYFFAEFCCMEWERSSHLS